LKFAACCFGMISWFMKKGGNKKKNKPLVAIKKWLSEA
jgi:hypothetical protein